jgi:hypothetical protein
MLLTRSPTALNLKHDGERSYYVSLEKGNKKQFLK